MPAPLLTPNDVAELCQISTKTVLRAIRSGRLAAARLGLRGAFSDRTRRCRRVGRLQPADHVTGPRGASSA